MSTDFASAPHRWEKEKSHFVALLDLKLEKVEHGKAVMRMPFREEIANGAGAVHGGAIVSLCDTVFYVALASIYGREQDTVTVRFAMQLFGARAAAARSDRRSDGAARRPPHLLRRSPSKKQR